ncbi:MAG: hypothetical protein HOV81_30055 [Kofleriaceae bacterium]|nr:hypothetical protein [Kofleriaceae bacterium]
MKNLKHILFAAILGSSGLASANAFNINEHDAKVTGRGGASAASNTDPSSIIFNPGGMAVGEGTNVSIGGSLIMANGSYETFSGENKTDTDSSPAVVPNAYLTSRVHDMVAVGVGFHLPFGLALSWPEGHPQSGVIVDQSLRTYFITPAVGINLNKQVPGLSIGGGVDIVPATVDLKRDVIAGDAVGKAHLGGDALGIGGRVGVMYHPPTLQQLKIGVMYRSQVKLDFSGKGDFDADPQVRPALPPDGDISTTIKLPQSFWGGVAYDPMPNLEIEANVVWINWKSFKELNITLPDGSASIAPENYKNTVTYRLGAEYKLPAQKAAIRAGFIYDPTPIPDTTMTAQLPDVNRLNVTLGGSKEFGAYAAHLGFLWVTPGERDTSMEPYTPAFKGTYHVNAFVASLQLSGHFGK